MDTAIDPGSKALRKGRQSEPGRAYLVTTVTVCRQRFFADFDLACVAARALTDPVLWRGSAPLCWVLMPDHWHAIVQLGEGEALETLVGRLKATSARRVNQVLGRRRALWASGFHDHGMRKDEDLREIARYMVANPVRAGIVSSARRYAFWDAVWLPPA